MSSGQSIHDFASALYPICRSITGNGVRDTLRLIEARIPLERVEVPSGTRVFDWEVPDEWNVEDAWIKDADGRKVVDFQQHNLHLMGYSEPVKVSLPLADLQQRLHSLPEQPDSIPYRTSYYQRDWAFCLRDRDRTALQPGNYEIRIAGSLAPGSLTYGECFLPGRTDREVLLFTHVCHPSLANDNTSGIAVLTALAEWLASEDRRFSYRLVFAPGTIGSLCWLMNNESRLDRVRHGLVLGLLGDSGPLTFKNSRKGLHEIDRVAPYALRDLGAPNRVMPFEPYGYDERQFCSPGFDLPVGRLTRSVNDGYAEYHTSGDDLALITPGQLQGSFEALQRILQVLESNISYRNMAPKGEPRLGKRGLYGSVGGQSPADSVNALLWLLNQSDGETPIVEIAERSGIEFKMLREAAERLESAGLLEARESDS